MGESSWIGKNEFVFQGIILLLIWICAFATRLFSVLRYESIIHEFDPWFNYRATKYLVDNGYYEFHNWYDTMTWYPYGRHIGDNVFPGLMTTSYLLHSFLHFVKINIHIREVCVFLAPFMAGNTTIAAYFLTKEAWNSHAGLVAAGLMAFIPGYISRSVAGSYDNECVAIFALVFTFYTWVKAVNTGSIKWGSIAALAYFYMVSTWGGYVFLINIIPIHVFVLMLCGRFNSRIHVAYTSFYVLGTMLSLLIRFTGNKPVESIEHAAAFGIFGLCHLYGLAIWFKKHLTKKQLTNLIYMVLISLAGILVVTVLLAISGALPFFTARLKRLLGSTDNLAIIKSVSEHQPTSWDTFFFDLHLGLWLFPAGLYFCFKKLSDATIFLILYGLFISYFAGIMIRLMLVIAPIACVMAGIALSEILSAFSKTVFQGGIVKKMTSVLVYLFIGGLFTSFVVHCTWVTSMAYSSPSIILQSTRGDGSRVIFDDFREAYSWLSHNTPTDAKIMSWWDYGYQITGMGNRTTIVDNNTRDNHHIAKVGRTMALDEERAYDQLQKFGVDYVLVVFGGMLAYSSDDINKFLWMVRISSGEFPDVIQESDYYSAQGRYTVDSSASETMKNSLMYKMCYYRFGEIRFGHQTGFDRVRGVEIGDKNVKLSHLEEAYTTENWMVRIYRVKQPHELSRFA